MKRYLLIHYSEIALKGSNINYFIDRLNKRLKFVLEKAFKRTFVVKHCLKRFLIELPNEFDEEAYVEKMKTVFGVQNFSFVYGGATDSEKLTLEILEKMPETAKFENFCVRIKKSQIMQMKSYEVEREIGSKLIDKGLKLPVKLKEPDLLISIEFFNDTAYFSFKKYAGAGGLPSNTSGKLISLISGGFDSPVAAHKMMKRGARIIFVHFHAYPYTDIEEINNVKDLVRILSNYQFDTKLYMVPIGEIQKKIAKNLDVPGKIRTILYRRIMFKIAEKIAIVERAKGLVTGDSLGQVASQTCENIFAVDQAASIVVYRPLISFDKSEIIQEALKIGTHEISQKPCKDTCTLFSPKNPEIRGNLSDILKFEAKLDINNWIDEFLPLSEIITYQV